MGARNLVMLIARPDGPRLSSTGSVFMSRTLDRVVIITDDSVASGGAASIAISSVRLLRSYGAPVTILTGDDGSNPVFRLWGADVVSLGGKHILGGSRTTAAFRGLFDPTVSAALRRWIDEHDTPGTVYHLHNWHKVLSPSALGSLRKVGSRLVVSTHDFFLACPNGGYFNFPRQQTCNLTPLGLACLATNCDKRHYGHKIWRVGRHALMRALLHLHDTPATILAVHDGMVPLLEKGGVPRRSIRVLRNPVVPWCRTRVAAERNGTVLYVGRLELDKGIDLLAAASRKIGVPLLIAGEGPLRETIGRLYPAAQLLGQSSQAAIAELAQAARMLVVPTRVRETFGLVALEAATSGIPVVSSSSNLTTGELVRIGAAISFDPADCSLLSATMSHLMMDNTAVTAMSRAGFSRASSLAPTEDQWCAGLIEIYGQKLRESERDGKLPHAGLTSRRKRAAA